MYIDGNGKLVSDNYSCENAKASNWGDGKFDVVESTKGDACYESGSLNLDSGVSLDLSGSGIDATIWGVIKINAGQDVDAPRLIAQDIKDGTSLALGFLGLAPQAGIPAFIAGFFLPSTEEMAKKGVVIGTNTQYYRNGEDAGGYNTTILKPNEN